MRLLFLSVRVVEFFAVDRAGQSSSQISSIGINNGCMVRGRHMRIR